MTPDTILLIDDNPDDYFAIQRCLQQAGLANPLAHIDEPGVGLSRLREAAAHDRLPTLVLLDINMPGMSGTELLAELRGDPRMAWLPVVMLTSSNDDRDVLAAFNGRANAWINKPLDYDGLLLALNKIRSHQVERIDHPGERRRHSLSIRRAQ